MTEELQARPRAPIADAVHIPVELIKPNPWNRPINDKRLNELVDSVLKLGVLQPVLVRPAEGATVGQPLYELIAGERRWQASRRALLDTIPALVRPMDDLQVIELMLVENLEREDLHALDEALGYDRLLRKDAGPQSLRGFASVDLLAERIGKSRSYIVQRLTLLKLCADGVKAFRAGDLTFSLALRIARLPGVADQIEATKKIIEGWGGEPMTARVADLFIHREYMLELRSAGFSITDDSLVPAAGSCTACPKRTGANPDLFNDIKQGDTCTDGACFAGKQEAHAAVLRAAAQAKGLQVISGAEAKKLKPQNYGDVKGLLELDKVHYNLDDKKKLRTLLAKADVKPVLFEDPHTHTLTEMVPADQALAALKASGVIKQAKMPAQSATTRAADDKAKRETEWRTAVAMACLDAARGDAGTAAPYRQNLIARLAKLLWREMGNDSRVRVTKLLGWPPLKGRWDNGPGITADDHIGALSDGELCRYLTAATIASDTYIASYQGPGEPTRLLDTAADLGVDVPEIKARLRKPERVTPPAAKARKAAQLTPETALAGAMKQATKKASTASAVKYRYALTGETWTGRGLQPAWLKAQLGMGRHLDDFLANRSTVTEPLTTTTSTEEFIHV
jgi:ParB/RepB/Spo0J family partition protein